MFLWPLTSVPVISVLRPLTSVPVTGDFYTYPTYDICTRDLWSPNLRPVAPACDDWPQLRACDLWPLHLWYLYLWPCDLWLLYLCLLYSWPVTYLPLPLYPWPVNRWPLSLYWICDRLHLLPLWPPSHDLLPVAGEMAGAEGHHDEGEEGVDEQVQPVSRIPATAACQTIEHAGYPG